MKLIAITTSYFPDENKILKNFLTIKKFIYRYIVVDNSEQYSFKILPIVEDIEILKNTNNGVSGGINLGLKRANELRADYVILFDQDSLCRFDMIEILINTMNMYKLLPVVVSPDIISFKTKKRIHGKYFDKGLCITRDVFQVPTTQLSGMLVPLSVFSNVGYFNEQYFLNLVDSEWCWRAFNGGVRIIIIKSAILYHEYADGEITIFRHTIKYGKPFRTYYASRDSLFLFCETPAPIFYKAKILFRLLLSLFEIIFLNERKSRIVYWFKGVFDFVRRRRGRGLENT